MKKILTSFIFVLFGLALIACYPVLEDENYTYHVTGYNKETDALNVELEAISFNDERISSITSLSKLDGVRYLYLKEITVSSADTGISIKYASDKDPIDAKHALWVMKKGESGYIAQTMESGKVENLTEDTLFVPPFNSDRVGDEPNWKLPFIAYQTGEYYAVFAEIGDGIKAFGLVPAVEAK